MRPPPEQARRIGLTLLLALAAALASERLRVPLPWMIGPLLATAACAVAGLPVAAALPLRNAGLALIGIALGLYFTPAVMALMLTLAPALLAGVAWAIGLGYAFYRFLLRVNGGDRATAFFAAAIGGASEMALLAERHGARVDRVAAAHSLRVLLVVVLVPLGTQLSGAHGADAALPTLLEVRPAGLLMLMAAAGGGVWLLHRIGAPNPWVLGALLVTLALTAGGVQLSALPRAASNAAQLVIGVSLGVRFTPDFAHAAPRWLGSVAAGTLAMIVASGAFAWLLAQGAGLNMATAFLGTAPGGIAEMCITAKVLQLGVPVVTAFQVLRYVAVLTLTGPLFRGELARGTVRAG
jgi:membrane AbrB-like protein